MLFRSGTVYFGPSFQLKMTLVVTAFQGYTLGRMTDEKRSFYLNFNYGSRARDGVLYLTTGRGPANWVHLRGTIKNGEYRGYVINGGRGIAAHEFSLKKVSD